MARSIKLCLVLIAIVLGILLPACAHRPIIQPSKPPQVSNTSAVEALINAQLEAYDRRDVEAFLSFYSDDAKLFKHPNQLTESGKAQLRARYQKSFLNKDVRAVILKRIVFDRFVIDHERLVGHPDGLIEAIAVYEVKDGKIVSVTFYKP
jgi:hypothetical protein